MSRKQLTTSEENYLKQELDAVSDKDIQLLFWLICHFASASNTPCEKLSTLKNRLVSPNSYLFSEGEKTAIICNDRKAFRSNLSAFLKTTAHYNDNRKVLGTFLADNELQDYATQFYKFKNGALGYPAAQICFCFSAKQSGNGIRKHVVDFIYACPKPIFKLVTQSDENLEDIVKRIAPDIDAKLKQLLDTDPFSALINDLTQDYFPRKKITDSINDFIENSSSGFVTIEGDAGAGKSAIMAKLLEQNRVRQKDYICAWHFIRFATTSSYEPSFARSIYDQLSAQLSLDGFKGRIDRVTEHPNQFNVSSFINDITLEAARLASAENKKLLIFLDAIDEADSRSKEASTNTFHVPRQEIDNTFFIVSGRSFQEEFYKGNKKPIKLNESNDDHVGDIKRYINDRLERSAEDLQTWLDEKEFTKEKLLSELLKNSNYLFLYLVQVFKDIQTYDPKSLPDGLDEYYKEQYNRLMDGSENKLGKKIILLAIWEFEPEIAMEHLEAFGAGELNLSLIDDLTSKWIELRLLEKDNRQDDLFFRFSHLSFYEYLKEHRSTELREISGRKAFFKSLAIALDANFDDRDNSSHLQKLSEPSRNEVFRIYFKSIETAALHDTLSLRLTTKRFWETLKSHDELLEEQIIGACIKVHQFYTNQNSDKARVFVDLLDENLCESKPPLLSLGDLLDLVKYKTNSSLFEALSEKMLEKSYNLLG